MTKEAYYMHWDDMIPGLCSMIGVIGIICAIISKV